MNKLFYIIILLITFPALSQERQTLPGRIVAGSNGVKDVYVINKTAGAEAKTDSKGYFNLSAKAGDALIIYSSKIIVREFALNQESFKTSPFVITVNYNAEELDEVVIDKYGKINSESLGLVPKGQKRYTVAERRVHTASAMTLGTIISIDPLINAISGRTKMLKRALETEKLEFAIEGMRGVYNEDEIMEKYKIPEEYVRGFLYYLAENKEFTAAIKSGNKSLTDFLMMTHSEAYLKMLADDKKSNE